MQIRKIDTVLSHAIMWNYRCQSHLAKAFDKVPRGIIWWTFRKLDVEKWWVRFVQLMYRDARSRVRVKSFYFAVLIGLHQGSVSSRLLLIIVLEAPPKVMLLGCRSDQTCFCFKNSENHILQLNLSNGYFLSIIFISLVRAQSEYSWNNY